MGKKPLRPGQLRRVGGVMMFSMAVGMLFALLFPSLSVFLSIVLLIGGFYFLFM
jgi:hypothetical protein